MWKYLKIYARLFMFSLKSLLTYRFNLFFKILYGPAYIAVLFLILQTAYSRTPLLGGWTKSESLLLFAVFNMIYVNCLVIFYDSIRYLLWHGIVLGEVDQWLLKPGSAQFYLTFFKPNTDHIALWISVTALFAYQLTTVSFTPFELFSFLILFVLGHVIVYLSVSTYATLGFYFTKAQQIHEIMDKATDLAQYPMTIFPQSIQLLFTTFLPIAYFSYIPTTFLLGRGDWNHLYLSIGFALFLFVLNRFAWKFGLRHYSSASS